MAPYRIIYGIVVALISNAPDVILEDCTCQPLFRCSNGVLLPQVMRCDGVNQCDDYTDEINCYPDCDGFRCNKGVCITALFYICDRFDDCDSAEDENCYLLGCSTNIVDPFLCKNGVCIPIEQVCDQADQCGDNSDELNCTECNNKTAFPLSTTVASIPEGFTFLPEFQTSYRLTGFSIDSHDQAEMYCEDNGGHLLLIDSDEKLAKMIEIGEEAFPNDPTPHWIINGRLVDGIWKDWQNRELLYTSFLEDTISYIPTGNCLKLLAHSYRGIAPADCSIQAHAICEIKGNKWECQWGYFKHKSKIKDSLSLHGALQPHDFQVSGSSHQDNYLPKFAMRMSQDGWCARVSDKHPFLQVDLLQPMIVTKVQLHGWVEFLDVSEEMDSSQTISLKGVKRFIVARSNSTNFADLTSESIVNGSEQQEQEFQLDTSFDLFARQAFRLCDRRKFRYIRIYPLESWQEDMCLKLMLYGASKDVDLDFMCNNNNQVVGMFNVGFGLTNKRHNSTCINASSDINEYESFCISDFSSIGRNSKNDTEQLLWSISNQCKDECSALLSCTMAKYSLQKDTCYIYTGKLGDLPIIEREATNEVIYQRLCLAETPVESSNREFVVTEETKVMSSPGYPYPLNLPMEQHFLWTIDFSKTATVYPVLLFEDIFFDEEVRFDLEAGGIGYHLFEDGATSQPSFRSPKIICGLRVYYRFSTMIREITFGFRVIVTNSMFPGSYSIAHNTESFYHQIGTVSSLGFNGIYNSDVRRFEIKNNILGYTTLYILNFYVSCITSVEMAYVSVETEMRTFSFCNLRRPWTHLKFSPTEGNLVVRLSLPFLPKQSLNGITANFDIKAYKERDQWSNDSYAEIQRARNAYYFGSADVIILLDATYKSAIDPRLEYLEGLVWRLKSTSTKTNNSTKFGLCAFSDNADAIFHLKDGWNKTDLATWFRLHAFRPWKRRCFACALSKIRTSMFSFPNGDRYEVPNIVVAILLASPFSAAASHNELRLAESEGIHVFIINTGIYGLDGIPVDMAVQDLSRLSELSIMHSLATVLTVKDAFKVDKVPVSDPVWQVCSEEACYALYPPIGKSGIEFFNTRSDANETCNNNHNGSLASVHSLTELQFIRHYLEKWMVTTTRSDNQSYSLYKELIHIDEITMSKGDNKYIYHWSDGIPVTFTAWLDKMSRLDLQRVCVVLTLWKLENDNIWNVGDCEEDSFYFLCKYTTDGNNETDTALFVGGNSLPPLSNAKEGAYFLCGSSEYVIIFSKCDGIRDCFDGSDERNCTPHEEFKAHCEDMFRCGSGECMPYSQYCDYIPDCRDKSDENCDFAPCNGTEWQCTNGQCVHFTSRCDGFLDCLDKADERDCVSCESKSYRCADGICISNLRVCDGFEDCIDASDEDNCNQEARESCLEWWKAGYRTTGIYKLIVGPEILNFECDFERAKTESILLTKFHDIDRDNDDGSLFYSSGSAVEHFLSTRTCTQTFTQTCAPNRNALSENMDLENHEEYWDCLCIDMAVEIIDTKNKTFHTCSNVTHQLVIDGVVDLEDRWLYDVDYVDITDVSIRKNNAPQLDVTDQAEKTRLVLGPITCEEKVSDLPSSIVCRRGKPVEAELKCLYDFDDFGYVKGCIDFTHLQTCDTFKCPIGYFKCPYSYCIAQRFVCDGQIDCLNGEDEAVCDSAESSISYCSGSFKCKGTKICIPEFQLCDGEPHCPESDDERICGLICPHQCSCTGLEITCDQVDRFTLLSTHPLKGSVLQLTNNTDTDFPVLDMPWLAKLNISSSKIHNFNPGVFIKMRNLLILDMSYNYIRTLNSYTFEGLSKLNILHLEGNYLLSKLQPKAFQGLQKIIHLRISKTSINKLLTNAFSGLESLQELDISDNQITTVEVGAFDGLHKLVLMNLSLNEINKFDKVIFRGLENLNHLVTDDYMFCCLKPESVSSENCLPHEDEFSSCSDLMRMDGPRYLLWIIGLSALVGNCLALVYRLIYDRSRLRIGYGIFVTNLCVSDFLMGAYLIIIAGADLYYRDIYVWNDKAWRFGALCNFAGFLSTVSSEASVFFICLVTIDRLLVIKYPFGQFKFTTKVATIASSVSWSLAILLALLPLLYKDYFKDGFYSKNAVCLALPLTRDKPNGWEYSLVVFVFLNFATFLLIAIGQWLLYREIHFSAHSVRSSRRKNDLKVARNLLLVVATDFLCWCPIGVMGLMALSGHVISADVYVWACVLILPINSALNPFLYTFSAIRNSKAFAPNVDEQTGSTYLDNRSWQKLWNSPEFTKPPPNGKPFVSLEEYLQSDKPNEVQIRKITEMLKARIEKLHSMEFYHGEVSTENIKVQHTNGEPSEMLLSVRPRAVTKPEDIAMDIKEIAVISRQLFTNLSCEESGF